jgi:phage N-6-adenine-methyltransferase
MSIPAQKPGRSKQDYGTPKELLNAVRKRLRIENFFLDIAASADNAVCDNYLTEENDALSPVYDWLSADHPYYQEWAWLNPPYSNIEPWVMKASQQARKGANIVMLVPASVGANWWAEWVAPYAYQTHLNGRLKFVGCEDFYPKDCSLLLYTPWGFTGHEIWTWQNRG